MEIEQILYETGRLQDAASLLNRISPLTVGMTDMRAQIAKRNEDSDRLKTENMLSKARSNPHLIKKSKTGNESSCRRSRVWEEIDQIKSQPLQC